MNLGFILGLIACFIVSVSTMVFAYLVSKSNKKYQEKISRLEMEYPQKSPLET